MCLVILEKLEHFEANMNLMKNKCKLCFLQNKQLFVCNDLIKLGSDIQKKMERME